MTKQFNFIDFFDSSQVYLDFILSCVSALHYIASISEQNDLLSVATTLDFAASKLKKLFSGYANSLQGGDNNEK